MFDAQLRSDIETLEVTINNYERLANAPQALERVKQKLAEALKPYNIQITPCPACKSNNIKCRGLITNCEDCGERWPTA